MIYVVFVQPSKELRVRMELERKGFKAYVPRRELTIHKSGLWTKIINIIFPGYVFVEMDYSPENHIAVTHTDKIKELTETVKKFDGVDIDKLKSDLETANNISLPQSPTTASTWEAILRLTSASSSPKDLMLILMIPCSLRPLSS